MAIFIFLVRKYPYQLLGEIFNPSLKRYIYADFLRSRKNSDPPDVFIECVA